MKQITRDLYTSGRVWLSLSHSFTQNSGDYSFDLVKFNGDFITLNAGALFVLSLWSSGKKTPEKFYIPEYKIGEFKSILATLYELRDDEKYVRDGQLTVAGKPSELYYRLLLNNKKYLDFYFVENNYNGDKSINIAIELTNKSGESNVYSMYDSNVLDLIDIIPSLGDIVKYKQSAAEIYFMHTLMSRVQSAPTQEKAKVNKKDTKKAPPRTVKTVDRTSISKEEVSYIKEEPKEEVELVEEPPRDIPDTTPAVVKDADPEIVKNAGYDYSNLLEDE